MKFRIPRMAVFLITCAVFGFVSMSAETASAQTGRYPRVIARGSDRDVIKSTPIELRPRRPLHFYGNTVRRNYYRSNPAGKVNGTASESRFLGNLGAMGQGLANWVTKNRSSSDRIESR